MGQTYGQPLAPGTIQPTPYASGNPTNDPTNPTGYVTPQDQVYTDQRGLRYVITNGQKYYLKPSTYGGTNSGGVFHNPDVWDPTTGTFHSGSLNWGAVIPIGAAAAMGAGVGAAALGGASAGSGGVGLGETGATTGLTDPAWLTASAPAGTSAAAGAGGAVDATSAFDAMGNFIGPSSVTGETGGAAAGLGTFLASPAGKLLMGILTTGGSAALGNLLVSHAAQNNVPPQLSQLLDMAVQRQQYQNPLFQAKTQGTYAMLPNYARQGTSLTGSLPGPAGPAYDPTGGLQSLFPRGGG